MAPFYPTTIPTAGQVFNYVDDVDWINEAKWDVMRDELIAVLTELGTLPKGAYASVKARLDAAVAGFIDRGDPAAQDFDHSTLTTDGTWRDMDLSGVVPVGAKGVFLRVRITDDLIDQYFMLRKKGHTNPWTTSRVRTQVANQEKDIDMIVACDANRHIQYHASNTTWTGIYITVAGWWF